MRAVPEDPQIEDVPHEPFYPSDTRTHPPIGKSGQPGAPPESRPPLREQLASNAALPFSRTTTPSSPLPVEAHASEGNVDGPLLA